MAPHLLTALSGPLGALEKRLLNAAPDIERWFTRQWAVHRPPVYSSVDVRNAGFKLAPVDTNLFPGGWNNLTPRMLERAAEAAAGALRRAAPCNRRVLLVPENHTRNLHYLSNVARLRQALLAGGMDVRVGSVLPELAEPLAVELPDGGSVLLEPVQREHGRLGLPGFDPGLVLLNHDLSAGIPPQLQGLRDQPVLPPLHAGWHVRRKTTHFARYAEVARELGEAIGLDEWLITPDFEACDGLDFSSGTGLEALQARVDALLTRVRHKYRALGVADEPFAIVKADNGTYGMGVMTVRNAAELDKLNRRTRNKMDVIKDGQRTTSVIVQEGVPTCERVGEAMAEPVVYLMDGQVAGGFYRTHAERGVDENLNAPGARFVSMACAEGQPGEGVGGANRFYPYAVIARLATLAASRELEAEQAPVKACEAA
ncbi:glutamate--cysteine ligase [Azohydromonas lata]|uniref:Glutamate--cysteine ligase n=1 Tax=Azohydromonas lata TaxID=45677 RepID=A0ABU5IES2_9BURK|nr:glutamate--cysteine ligase [Azohydromonas lata]MDZ5457462.1 glutamate--cysteine ligase [Azohydromonas lata]